MPNWKNASDYKFAESLTPHGWAWEFMRRNEKYKADWMKACSGADVVYDPPKREGETDTVWRVRVSMGGGRPRKMHLAVHLGHAWGMLSAIQNPDAQQPPKFNLQFPVRVEYDLVAEYFENEEPFPQKDEFAVLVFNLRRPLRSQIDTAKTKLNRLQKDKTIVSPKKISQKKWTTYLRLIDAETAGAAPKQIRKDIKAYHSKTDDPEDLKKATDCFSDHRKAAHALRDNPLSILP